MGRLPAGAGEKGAERMKPKLHRISHWLRWQPCELLDIIHEPECHGTVGIDCKCNWMYVLKCKKCGEVITCQ